MMRNWKTTAIGIILAFSSFVSFSPDIFGGRDNFIVVKLSYFISSGGLAVLEISAKALEYYGRLSERHLSG